MLRRLGKQWKVGTMEVYSLTKTFNELKLYMVKHVCL